MKKSCLLLTAFLFFTPQESQAISRLATFITIPASYVIYKIIQSIDLIKLERYVRQDKDMVCQIISSKLERNCNHPVCKDIISRLEEAQSTSAQKMYDKGQESVEYIREKAYPNTLQAQELIAKYNSLKSKVFDVFK